MGQDGKAYGTHGYLNEEDGPIKPVLDFLCQENFSSGPHLGQ